MAENSFLDEPALDWEDDPDEVDGFVCHGCGLHPDDCDCYEDWSGKKVPA